MLVTYPFVLSSYHFCSDSVFQIFPRYKYDAQQSLNAQLDMMNRTKSSIGKKAGELEDIEDKELQQLKVAIRHPNQPSQQYVSDALAKRTR